MKRGHGAAAGAAAACLALLVTALLPSSCERADRHAVARVNDHYLPETPVVEQLRGILWRNGEVWENIDDAARQNRRREAAEACVDQHLLEAFTAMHPAPADAVGRQAEENFQQFLRQFEPPDGWEKRAALQGFNAMALEKQISAGTGESLALEGWLAGQSPKVTEAQARGWYEAHRASFAIAERVRASQIFLTRHDQEKPDRAVEIAEISRKLKSREATFTELATQFSDDEGSRKRGGDMGWFTRERVPAEFAEKVFALPPGQVSGAFESHLGWHFVLVREKRPARIADFAEMKEEITALLQSRWREEQMGRLKQRLRTMAKIEFFDARLRAISPE